MGEEAGVRRQRTENRGQRIIGRFRIPNSALLRMPLEVSCPSCSGQFRVPDSAAGKKIRCPKCKGAMEVPTGGGQEAEGRGQGTEDSGQAAERPAVSVERPPPRTKAAAPPDKPQPKPEMWFLKSEEGEDYGPVTKDELDDWFGEGRITAECQLLCEGTDQWQWAGDVYAELTDAASPAKEFAPPSSQKKPATRPRESSVAASDDSPPSTRSRLVAGLLGIFLGPLGTHRFYLGYWVIGLAMLATGGGCGIWSLIDAILIFAGKVPDADGRRLT